MPRGSRGRSNGRVGRYVEEAGYVFGKSPIKPPGTPFMRGAHAFEACKDGSLVIYATLPDGDGEPIRIESLRVMDLEREIAASGLDAHFAMSNAAQCSTAGSFAGGVDVQQGSNDLAAIAGTLPPAAPASTNAAKAKKKERQKKGVSKFKSSRW